MKVKIIRSKFLESLKKVQNIVGAKGSMMIIQNVLIEAKDNQLSLTTTDLDISIRSTVACEVVVEGSTTLPAKLLVNAISKAVEGPVEIEIDANDRAQISAGSALFKLSGMSVIDFPALPTDQNSFEYVVQQNVLRDMLHKTSYAASQDDTRKTLKGVLMSFKDGKLTMVATDGRRLALAESDVEFPPDENRDIILPSKVVAELQRSLAADDTNVHVKIEKTQISFNMGDTCLYSKLLDEIYPNYHQVIPQEMSECVLIDRTLLLAALDRVSVMTMDESNSTKLTFDSNELTVSSTATETGSARDVVPVKYDGPHIDIVFNPGYVMDPLKAINDEEVTIEMNDGNSPALLKCVKQSNVKFLYVMMPLRIN